MHPWFGFSGLIYAAVLLVVVAAAAHLIGHLVPFYRRELGVESRTRLTPLDGLRGILSFAVMAVHGAYATSFIDRNSWEPPTNTWGLLGRTSVGLFFCMTAFLFWTKAVRRPEQMDLDAIAPFFRARVLRLVPLYLFSCAASLLVAASEGASLLSRAGLASMGRMGLLGLRLWGDIGAIDMNLISAGVVWTLRYEWAFYLFLPALAPLARDGGVRLWFVLLAFLVIFAAGPVLFFVPGVFAFYALQRPTLAAALRGRAATVGVLAVIGAAPWLTRASHFDLSELVLTAAIFIPIACGNTIFGLLTGRGLRLMGVVSYSVYLLHGIGLHLAIPTLARIKHAPGSSGWHYWLVVIALGLIMLLVSLLTYRWVEWPFMQWDKQLRTGRGTEKAVRGPEAMPGGALPASA